jgi:hypothetical protein
MVGRVSGLRRYDVTLELGENEVPCMVIGDEKRLRALTDSEALVGGASSNPSPALPLYEFGGRHRLPRGSSRKQRCVRSLPAAGMARPPGLIAGLQALAAKGQAVVYKSVHKILAEGNFVLVVAEATFGGVPTGIYDLFRIEKGRIAEHWDTLEAIPPRDQWKNSNGKF